MTISAMGLSAIREGRTILHSTDLTIKVGERVALVGASGSGKSTLGHELADQMRGDGVTIAHVPQSPDEALDPLRSLAFHWRQAERALGLPPDPDRRKNLFAALGIVGGDLRARSWGWSRGMQQRFVIAMALLGRPSLLILDEPTSALDPVIAAATMSLLDQHLYGSSTAMLLITHDLGLATTRADRVLVLENGRIIEDGKTSQILTSPASDAARTLVANRNWAVLQC